MAVTESDVQKITALARLRVSSDRLPTLVTQLNDILGHMDVLRQVDTTAVSPTLGVDTHGMPLREDIVAPVPLHSPATALTAESRDGFMLVPRLSTHEHI